jgi:hypothetical protein
MGQRKAALRQSFRGWAGDPILESEAWAPKGRRWIALPVAWRPKEKSPGLLRHRA